MSERWRFASRPKDDIRLTAIERPALSECCGRDLCVYGEAICCTGCGRRAFVRWPEPSPSPLKGEGE